MEKIALISTYFGKFPNYFSLFVNSCKSNPDFDFLIFSDCKTNLTLPSNVKIIKISFDELKEKIQSKFDFKIALNRPYKLCDYKVAYGYIFEKELKEYAFWGHCDIDLIFGDLKKFLPKEAINNFDKIFQLGHLTIYRNSFENNKRFMLKSGLNYKSVFSTNNICIFDEINGIGDIFKKNNIPVFKERYYADISVKKKKFTLCDEFISPEQKKTNNFDLQIFYYENGKVYRDYFDANGNIKTNEFNYIHFSKRQMPVNFKNANSFYITNTGFYKKDSITTKEIIEKLNPNDRFGDNIALFNYWKGRVLGKIQKTTTKIKENLL